MSLVPVAALVVLLTASATVALSGLDRGPQAVTTSGAISEASTGSILNAQERDAQGWLITNAGTGERLILDDGLAPYLRLAGWSQDDLVPFAAVESSGNGTGWRAADYLVSSSQIRWYANISPGLREAIENSVTVATFGTGDEAVDVRRIVPAGATVASADIAARTADRATLGRELARNLDAEMAEADRARFAAGEVDSRIVALLASVAAGGPVAVTALPVVDGEQGEPIRQVALRTLGGKDLVKDGRATALASAFVDGSLGDYAPARTHVEGDDLVLTYSVWSAPAAK